LVGIARQGAFLFRLVLYAIGGTAAFWTIGRVIRIFSSVTISGFPEESIFARENVSSDLNKLINLLTLSILT
jgi:hypothetical protein